MIDWLTVVINAPHEAIEAGSVISTKPDGQIDWISEKRLPVEGSYSETVNIKTLDRIGGWGSMLWVSGCPAKWLQGHNLFGSDDLPRLVPAFLRAVLAQVGIYLGSQHWDDIDRGEYQLKRVDCTQSFALPSREDVRGWIRAALPVVSGKKQKVGGYDAQTLYVGQNSRRISLKIYCKGDELEEHGLPKDMPVEHEKSLLKFADNLLRVEVTIRSMELKRRGLEVGSGWGYDTSYHLLQERLESMNLPENLPLKSTADGIEGLPARMVAVYKLWLQGEDLRQLYPKKTYYRYRAALLPHGIDLNTPPRKAETSNVVPMWRYLVAEPVGVPDWAYGTPLYFDPSKPALRAL